MKTLKIKVKVPDRRDVEPYFRGIQATVSNMVDGVLDKIFPPAVTVEDIKEKEKLSEQTDNLNNTVIYGYTYPYF